MAESTAEKHNPPTDAAGAQSETAHHEHPSDWEYIKVALFLAVVTGAEVGLFYVEGLGRHLYILILLVMMAVKFSVVVMWFMHLRFDSKIFRRFFVTGVILACFVYLIVLTTFHVWSR